MDDMNKLIGHLRKGGQLETLINSFLFDYGIEYKEGEEYSDETKQWITEVLADVFIATEMIRLAFGIDNANLTDMKYYRTKRALLNWEAHEKGNKE